MQNPRPALARIQIAKRDAEPGGGGLLIHGSLHLHALLDPPGVSRLGGRPVRTVLLLEREYPRSFRPVPSF